jgi:hypothetical protein
MCIPHIVARQRLGKNLTVAMNTHATIEELLDASFSMRSVSCEEKVAISPSHNFLLYMPILFKYWFNICTLNGAFKSNFIIVSYKI